MHFIKWALVFNAAVYALLVALEVYSGDHGKALIASGALGGWAAASIMAWRVAAKDPSFV